MFSASFNGDRYNLAGKIDPSNALLLKLEDCGLIRSEHRQHINGLTTDNDKVTELLTKLERQSDDKFEVFCKALEDLQQNEVAQRLRENVEKGRLIKETVLAGKCVFSSISGVYDEAKDLYNFNEQQVEVFRGRNRTLEIALVNASSYKLVFKSEYFDEGTWFFQTDPLELPPNSVSLTFVANRARAWFVGVCGSFKYAIDGTNKCLFLGFKNPYWGSYKTFVGVSDQAVSVKWAYNNTKDDTVKCMDNEMGFRLTCKIRPPKLSPHKMFEYAIMDATQNVDE